MSTAPAAPAAPTAPAVSAALARAMQLLALEEGKRDAAVDAYLDDERDIIKEAVCNVSKAKAAVAMCEVDVLKRGERAAQAEARVEEIKQKSNRDEDELREAKDDLREAKNEARKGRE